MRKNILIFALILGLVTAPVALAQTTTRAGLIAQLMAQINVLRAQIQLLQQRQLPVPAGQVAGGFYPSTSGIRLDYLQALGGSQPNQIRAGRLIVASGSGFTSAMKVIISGQRPTEQAYTAVIGANYLSPVSLSFWLPADVPTGTLDIHLADVTSRTSRVSNTLLVEVAP